MFKKKKKQEYVAVCMFLCFLLCVSDVTASVPWAGMTRGCSEHIHIN